MVNHSKSCCCKGCTDISPAVFVYIGPDTSSVCGKIEHEEPRYYCNNFPFLFEQGTCDRWFYDKCSPFCMQNEDVIHPVVNVDDHEIVCGPENNEFCFEEEVLDEDGNPTGEMVTRVRVGLEVRIKPVARQGQDQTDRASTWWPFGDRDYLSGGFNMRKGDIRLKTGSLRFPPDMGDADKQCLPTQVAEGFPEWGGELYQGSDNVSYGDPNPYTGNSWTTKNWPGLCMSWGQSHLGGGEDSRDIINLADRPIDDDLSDGIPPAEESEKARLCGIHEYDLPLKFIYYDRYFESGPPSDPNETDPTHDLLDPGAIDAANALYMDIKERFGPQKLSDGSINPLPGQIYFGVDNSGSMSWCTSEGDPAWDCPAGCEPGGDNYPDCCPPPPGQSVESVIPLNPGAWQIAKVLYDLFVDDIGEEAATFKFNPHYLKFNHENGTFINPEEYTEEEGGGFVVDGTEFDSLYNTYTPPLPDDFNPEEDEAPETINFCAGHSCDQNCFLWEYPANPDYWWFADLIPPIVQHKIFYDINNRDIKDELTSGPLGSYVHKNYCTDRMDFSLYYCDCVKMFQDEVPRFLAGYARNQMATTRLQAWELPVFYYDASPIPYSGELFQGGEGVIQDSNVVHLKTGEDYLGGLNDMMAKHFKCCNCSADKVEACGWPNNWPIPGWWECNGQNPASGQWPDGSDERRERKEHCGWGGSSWPEQFGFDSPINFRQDLTGNPVYESCYKGAAPCTIRYMAPFTQLSQYEIHGNSTFGDEAGVCPTANIHQKGVPCKCPEAEPPRLNIRDWNPTCDPEMVFPCEDILISGLPPDSDGNPQCPPGCEPGGENYPECCETVVPTECDPQTYLETGSPIHPLDRDEEGEDSDGTDLIVCVKNCDCDEDDPEADSDCATCFITTEDDCDYWGGQSGVIGACCLYGECVDTAAVCCESKGGEWFGEGTDCTMPEFKYCKFEDECDPDACYYWFSDTYDPDQAMPGEECIPEDPCEKWNYTDPFNPGASRYYACCNISGKYACENVLDCPGTSTPQPETGACCYPAGDPRWCQRRLEDACEGLWQGPDTSCSTYYEDEDGNGSWQHACPVDWDYGACCYNSGTPEGYCGYAYKDYCEEAGGDFRQGSCLNHNCTCTCNSDCVPFWEINNDTPPEHMCFFPACCQFRSQSCGEGTSIQCLSCEDCPCDTEGLCPCPDDTTGCGAVLWTCPESPSNGTILCFGDCCD